MGTLGLSFKTKGGWITVETRGDRISGVTFSNKGMSDATSLLAKLKRDFTDYFEGKEVDFSGYELELGGYSEFQAKVVRTAQKVKYGRTISYGELARRAGHPNAQRAVGSVMSNNRFGIIVPCHRVVGAHGIGGFTPDIEDKRRLLALEKVRI